MNAAPLMTLALSTWNHERYVEQAIAAALAQDYQPLEIIISDDASTDDTFAIAQRLVERYSGRHEVRLNRNARNLGVGAHNDLLMQMSRGEMVVLSAGDDIDEADRVSRVARQWRDSAGKATAVTAPLAIIDGASTPTGVVMPIDRAAVLSPAGLAGAGIAIPGGAFARRLYGMFGAMGPDVIAAEDIVLGLRAALAGQIVVLDRPLMRYRQHGVSLLGSSGPLAPSAQHYRAGFQRMLSGMLAARRVQLADIACAQRLGLLSAAQASEVAVQIERHLQAELRAQALLQRRLRPAFGLLWQTLRGQHPPRAAVKALLAGFAPAWWFRYIRWRRRRLDGHA